MCNPMGVLMLVVILYIVIIYSIISPILILNYDYCEIIVIIVAIIYVLLFICAFWKNPSTIINADKGMMLMIISGILLPLLMMKDAIRNAVLWMYIIIAVIISCTQL